jgi:rhamnulokinase
MDTPLEFLAFDLGAESGRAVLGALAGGRLTLREVHRFANGPVRILGHDHWNLPSLFEEIKKGIRLAARDLGSSPESLAVDTWGVDFGLVAADGSLLGLPYAYRDSRTEGAMDFVFHRIPRREVYALTGIQFLPFNTLFQLAAMVRDRSPLIEAAAQLLFMPDLFHYLMTGRRATEFTIASTSQIFDPGRMAWSAEILAALGLPESLMPEVLTPGSVLGPVSDETAEATGLRRGTPVVATATHDTGAAVAAVPAEGEDWAYISSGTWSLVGIESPRPLISPRTLDLNFTNEGGLGGRIRFLKNMTGLWLLQGARRAWEAAGRKDLDYAGLVRASETARPFVTLVDPDDPEFLNPPDMVEAIRSYARRTGQPEPASIPATVRCILESLALKSRAIVDQLKRVSPHPVRKLHVIGGGSRNAVLCRFTAEATGLTVLAGPAEATASGNVLGQALALGAVASVEDFRSIMRNSCALEIYEPREPEAWSGPNERFRRLLPSE